MNEAWRKNSFDTLADDCGRASVRMRMSVSVWECLFCFCLVFNFPRRIPQFPSGSLWSSNYHEGELAMNGNLPWMGIWWNKASIGAEAWRRREEVDEEADNDSVDSLICACGSRIKRYGEGRLSRFVKVKGDHLQETMAWIREDTERDYSQTEYVKTLVIGDVGADGEICQVMPILKATMCEPRGKIVWIQEGKWQPFARDDDVDSGGYRARLQSDKIWEEHW